MAQISRYKIHKDVLTRLQSLFFEVVARQNSKDKFMTVLNDLLSSTENIMLSKRIGIVYLLEKKVTIHRICKVLHLSTSTVAHYILKFRDKNSLTNQIVKNIVQKEVIKGTIKDALADLLIQPGIKVGHSRLKYEWEKEREKRKEI